MVFIGHHEHSIDSKNRLAIPSKFRSLMDPERDGTTFVMVPGKPAGTLWLYTERHFDRLAGRGESTLIPDDDQLEFDQVFFALAARLEIDTQGRILIPDNMLRRANLGRDVVICGVRDHLEIRRRDDFERQIDTCWERYRELQLKAQGAYRENRRQSGGDAGNS